MHEFLHKIDILLIYIKEWLGPESEGKAANISDFKLIDKCSEQKEFLCKSIFCFLYFCCNAAIYIWMTL